MLPSQGPSGILTPSFLVTYNMGDSTPGGTWAGGWGGGRDLSKRVLERTWACARRFGGRSKDMCLLWVRYCQDMPVTWSFLRFGQRSCWCLCSNLITEYPYFCLHPSQSEWAYQRSAFCEAIYVKQETCKAYLSVSGQLPHIRGCFSLSHTLSTRRVGLHSSQTSIVIFTLNSQFLHFWCVFVICFSLEANMQASDPHFTLFFPEFLFMKQKATVSLANYLPCWEMIKSAVQFMFSRSTT